MLGVPGTGKSAFAKALGAETGRPTLILDIGSLMGSLVGSTEANIRQALKIIDAMEPCICFIDEVEKSAVGRVEFWRQRRFGTALWHLPDLAQRSQSDVFTICTCNDISKLPPEFSRAERFDGCFFLDLPSSEQRRKIWEIYRSCSIWMPSRPSRTTSSGPVPRFVPAAVWPRCWTCL